MSQSYRALYNELADAKARAEQAKQDIAKLEERVLKIGKDTIVTQDGTIKVIRPKGSRVIDVGLIEDVKPAEAKLIAKVTIDLSTVDALVKTGKIAQAVVDSHTSYKDDPKPTIKIAAKSVK